MNDSQANWARPQEGRKLAFDESRVSQILAEQEQLIAELKRKNEEMDQFSRLVSHDLRSPLHTIRGFAEIIHQDLLKGQTMTLLPDVERILDAGARMQNLLDGIAAVSKAGRSLGVVEQVNMSELLAEVLGSLRVRLESGNIKIATPAAFPEVAGDRTRLRTLISIILENAIDSLEGRSEPVIEVGVGSDAAEHVFYFKNNGSGIPADRLASLFTRFFTSESQGDERGASLAIARRIVEAHCGRIWVESDGRGKGSCFHFSIPISSGGSSQGA